MHIGLRFRRSGAAAGLTLAAAAGAFACGGDYQETVLDHPRAALVSPPAGFWDQVARVEIPPSPLISRLEGPSAPTAFDDQPDTLDLELDDLRAVLGAANPALADYRALREVMQARYEKKEKQTPDSSGPPPAEDDRGAALLEAAVRDEWPAGLPADVVAYLRGARRYLDGDEAGAIVAWKDLMAWPEADRPNRSTWAAWMLAKTARAADPASADGWYRETGRLAQAGFRDPLHLGRYAAGWLARSALARGDRREALTIYANQALSGDRFGYTSLMQALPDLTNSPDAELDTYAADPFMRRLLTAQLLRERSSVFYDFNAAEPEEFLRPARRWLAAVQRTNADLTAEAEQIAWMAYQLGDFETCARWLERAPADAAVANSLRGKLALQRGAVEEADRYFQNAADAQPAPAGVFDHVGILEDADTAALRAQHALADHAVVQIALRRYDDALRSLLRAGYADDTAYVAERLLSTADLVRATDAAFARHEPAAADLSAITGRRLAREGHLETAARYLPAAWRPILADYGKNLSTGKNPANPSSERAAAQWKAAQIHFLLGRELFATRDFPDTRNWPGYDDLAQIRAGFVTAPGPRPEPPIQRDEFFRAARHRTLPAKRDHYVYRAADLAWEAAKLMPDHSEQTARTLGIAGTWLKYRDPQAADRFYKALIWRNWATPLAREADRRRWFPPIEWDYDPFAAAGLPKPSVD